MKKLGIIALIILLFCGAALWYLASQDWNGFLKSQLEIRGTALMGEPVTVQEVDLKLMEGFGAIRGFKVANPEGFNAKHAIDFGEVAMDIDLESLRGSPIVIEHVTIKDPKAFIEFTGTASSNIQELISNVKKQLPKGNKQPQPKAEDKQETLIAIKKITLSGMAVKADTSKLNSKVYDVNVPAVELGSIGGDKGLPADQIGAELANRVLEVVEEQAEDMTKQTIMDKAEKEGKKLLDKLFKKD
ncbi:hypothetical protein FE810_09895 [Thalassotalea litorea]|uniref:AsmA domain-containing protein n=1 Tax=Thalassotalea litorea TaxID=2020715 RepID=A0A5R9IL23_9GAMM|nr:AsmA family protein [Thalassotalea litorea]TLU64767.1 hypothetical protein FE810_09895 [Thalassotalea litorea]